MGDVARGAAVDILAENSAHNFRLCLDDHAFAGITGQGNITIGQPAGVESLANAARLASPNLVSIIFAIELTDQTAKPDQYGIDHALMDCTDLNPQKGQPLVNAGEVLHVTGESVQRFDDDYVKRVFARFVHKPQQAVAS